MTQLQFLPKHSCPYTRRQRRGRFVLPGFLRSNRCAAAIAQYPADL